MSLEEYISFVKKLVKEDSYTYKDYIELIRLRYYSDFHSVNNLYNPDDPNDKIIIEIATHYQQGLIVKRDYNKAYELLKNAPQTANIITNLAFLYEYRLNEDKTTSFNLFKQAADMGNERAKRAVVLAFEYGRGVEQDKQKATSLAKELMIKGYFFAYNLLGLIYSNVTIMQASFDMHHVGSELGDIHSIYNLAIRYFNSDKTKYLEILKNGEKTNFPLIFKELGRAYLFGYGTSQNLNTSINYYLESARLDYDSRLLDKLYRLYQYANEDQKTKILKMFIFIDDELTRNFLKKILEIKEKEDD